MRRSVGSDACACMGRVATCTDLCCADAAALLCRRCRNRLMALAAAHHSSAQIIKSTSLSARSNVREIVRSLKLEGVVDERGNGNGKVEV